MGVASALQVTQKSIGNDTVPAGVRAVRSAARRLDSTRGSAGYLSLVYSLSRELRRKMSPTVHRINQAIINTRRAGWLGLSTEVREVTTYLFDVGLLLLLLLS